MRKIYLDYTATTPVDKKVVEEMMPFFQGVFGNASSIHSYGRDAKAALEKSRETIASLLDARASEIFFTSGGTESDNSALAGIALNHSGEGKRHLVISAIEHHAVLGAAQALQEHGLSVSVIGVDSGGFVPVEKLRETITNDTILVSVLHANNEIGTIQNLRELVEVSHEHGALFHTDAVQSFGKTEFSVKETGVDLASVTAHKMYGPKGVGALYIKRGIDFEPMFHGGSQERERRAGTESVPLAVGFAKAAHLCMAELETERKRLGALNAIMRERIAAEVPGAIFNSPPKNALANILSVSIDSGEVAIDGDAIIVNMDLEGIAVTSGSACSSGSLQPSHVIRALGRDEETTKATVRFSLGRFTTEEEVRTACDVLAKVVAKIGKRKKVSSPAS